MFVRKRPTRGKRVRVLSYPPTADSSLSEVIGFGDDPGLLKKVAGEALENDKGEKEAGEED